MDFNSFKSKIVLSNDEKVLGKVTDVTKARHDNFIVTIEYSKKGQRDKCCLSLKSFDVLEIKEEKIILDISKKEFFSLAKKLKIEQKQRIKNTKMAKVSEEDTATARTLTSRW